MPSRQIAKILLEMGVVSLSPLKPFTYTSGLKSPIYCDHRLLISFLDERQTIIENLISYLESESLDFDLVAGTATAAIPWAAWVADRMNKSMAYVRSTSKEHGKENKIEGQVFAGQKILVVEDLVSTGMSSLATVEVLRGQGCEVNNCLSIFTYELKKAKQAFKDHKVVLHSLTNFTTLIEVAIEEGKINSEQEKMVLAWKDNPEGWAEKYHLG